MQPYGSKYGYKINIAKLVRSSAASRPFCIFEETSMITKRSSEISFNFIESNDHDKAVAILIELK